MRVLHSLAVLLPIVCVAPVLAQDTTEWETVGDWLVGIDPSLDNSCYALNAYDDGSVLRIGLDMSDPEGRWYMVVGNDAWRSIEVDGEYDVAVQFDNEPEWTAVATGIDMGSDANFLYIFGSDVDFFDEFTRKHGMQLFYNDAAIANVSLRGSTRAILSMIDCQDAQDARQTADPFAGKKTKSGAGADPFAQ